MSATLADATIIDAAEIEARKRARREKKLVHKRLERERRAAAKLAREIAAAERARLEAIETERAEELLAPAVLRGAIMARGTMLRGPVVRIVAGRPMIGPEFSFAPRRSRQAAACLRMDWQESGAGLNVGAVDYMRSAGIGGTGGAHASMVRQIATRARLDAALAHLGADAPIVSRLVFDCIPIPIWVGEQPEPVSPEAAIQIIRRVLARLADFYWPAANPPLHPAT